jgi:urease accessory protein
LTLALLHLCDSLFPIGAFAYSDGLEAAPTLRLEPNTTTTTSTGDGLRDWIDVVLDESIGRLEGPAVWQAWLAVAERDWRALAVLDEELTAIRPASASRAASRAMGRRLLTTWRALHPDERLAQVPASSALPIAFAAACACGDIARRDSVEAYAYTRLAATASAAMRLLPVGQTDAHRVLATALTRVPRVVDRIAARGRPIESFSPALDIAAMTQQYLHSRLFRS